MLFQIFSFDCDRNIEMKTLFTKKMLDNKFLASNAFYSSTAHTEKYLNIFFETLDKTFFEISPYINDKDKKLPKGFKKSHDSFYRLN